MQHAAAAHAFQRGPVRAHRRRREVAALRDPAQGPQVGYACLGRDPGGFREEVMRRSLICISALLALAACQPLRATPEPRPSAIIPTVAATLPELQTPPPAGPLFDGFNMFTATSGWAWKGLSQLYRTDDG